MDTEARTTDTPVDMDTAAAVAAAFFSDPADRSPKGSAMSLIQAERAATSAKTEKLKALRMAKSRT